MSSKVYLVKFLWAFLESKIINATPLFVKLTFYLSFSIFFLIKTGF
jgi:hypothetical protein